MTDPAQRDDRPGDDHVQDEAPRPPREPVFNLPSVVLVFILACAAIHLARTVLLTPMQDETVLLRFAFIPARYSGRYLIDIYAFISPLSYSLLHGSWLHLGVNMIWLAAFGSPLAVRIGTLRFVLFWMATALAAALMHYLVHANGLAPVIGASGAIAGMMGAAARFGFSIDRRQGKPAFSGPVLSIGQVLRRRAVIVFVGVWLVVNVITGLGVGVPGVAGQIAWEAHIGGFLAGFFGLFVFVRRKEALPTPEPEPEPEPRPDHRQDDEA